MNVESIRPRAGISALPLMVATEDLAGAARLGQVRSLVVQRQADIGQFVSDREVGIELQARQSEIRRQATHYLDRLMPEAIKAISSIEQGAALVQSVQQAFDGAQDQETRDALLTAITSSFQDARDGVADMKRLTERALQAAKWELDALGKCIDGYLAQVHDDEGELAVLEGQIAEANQAMSAAVQQTVTSGMKVGSQAKKLVTWIFSMFSTESQADKPKDKTEDTESTKKVDQDAKKGKTGDGEDKPGDKTKKTRPSLQKPEEPFPGETIGEISGETSTVLDAASELNRHAARLRGLYLRLYNLDAVLGASALIKQQGRGYVQALAQLDDAARVLTTRWDGLIQACSHPDLSAGAPFDPSWAQLDRRIDYLARALSGADQTIPQLGRVDNVISINQPGEAA